MSVVEHGSIGYSFMTVCKMFQILVVGCYDTIGLLLAEFVEHRFSYGTANARFCTRTELIYQYDGTVVGSLHHIFHVEEVGRVGTEVVLQTLFVTDINHDVLEYTRLRAFAY